LPLDLVPRTLANRIDTAEKPQALPECGYTTNNAASREQGNPAFPHGMAGARLLVKACSRIDSIDNLDIKWIVSTRGSRPVNAMRRGAADQSLRFELVEVEGPLQALEMGSKDRLMLSPWTK
jgi:glutamate/aspartate transport system substrate-binding protein